jgi:hypothetical protein
MASIIQVTPEIEKEIDRVIEFLKPKVEELNKLIPEFKFHILNGKFMISADSLESMPEEYNKDFKAWMYSPDKKNNSAIDDFMNNVFKPYKCFDNDSYVYDEKSKDPSCYVTIETRQITLGSFGSVWMDMPLTGKVGDKMVTKWTRVSFQYITNDDKWILRFDPTGDGLDKFDDPKAEEYCKTLTTGGVEVDLTM